MPNSIIMNIKNYAIILAAGSGSRMELQDNTKKQFLLYQGKELWWHSFEKFYHSPLIHGIILVFPEQEQEFIIAQQRAKELIKEHNYTIPVYFVKGGKLRQDSVFEALKIVPLDTQHVLIHDSARPFFSPTLITNLLENLSNEKKAVIPSLPLTDTIKEFAINKKLERIVTNTPNRNFLRSVQTPQAFHFQTLFQAHKKLKAENRTFTDDAMLMEEIGELVYLIEGDPYNYKITVKQDLSLIKPMQNTFIPVSGYGYDVHKYQGNRPFILGGIEISTDIKITAHSDGDVLIHALMDALISCMADGDIGHYFPDTDKKYENISSLILLDKVLDKWKNSSLKLCHVDLTIICQKPKIAPYITQIKKNMCRILQLSDTQINVKATTEEGLGFTGQLQGIKAVALVSAIKEQQNQ